MKKKVIGIFVVGLLMTTLVPVGSSLAQPTEERSMNTLTSQLEIMIKGGFGGIHAFIQNIGTTDINDAKMTLVLDGPVIFPASRYIESTGDFEAGTTKHNIFVVFGFGPANIEFTVDTTTVSASALVFGYFVFGVH